MMFSLLYTFCLHFYLINIHIFDYPDSRLSGLFTEVPTSPDNRGSTVLDKERVIMYALHEEIMHAGTTDGFLKIHVEFHG